MTNPFPLPPWSNLTSWNNLYKHQRHKVKTIVRDNYRCKDCGNGHDKLLVHHLDESGTFGRNDLLNLVTLCKKCHAIRHGFNKTNLPIYERLTELSVDGNLTRGVAKIVGDEFKLSRERIRQLAKKMGFKTANDKDNPTLFKKCKFCGKEFIFNRYVYCSNECRKKKADSYWTTVKCKECQKSIRVLKSYITIGRVPVFCGKICQGKFMARTVGFIAHPENRGHNSIKYTKEFLIHKFNVGKFTVEQFARECGLSSTTSAYNTINSLIFRGLVTNIGGKGSKRILKIS